MSEKWLIGSEKDKKYAIISSLGGTVTEFVWEGNNIIYPERKIGEKSRGGIPICFPYFGMPHERFGTQKHGWLRNEELKLDCKTDNQIVLRGENEPTEKYPWRLRYCIKLLVGLSGLKQSLTVKRLDDGKILSAPINPGFHPYFANHGNISVMINGERITNFPENSEKIAASDSIIIDSGKYLIQMELGGNYNEKSCITLWSDNCREYSCIEPVLTWPNLFGAANGGDLYDK